MKSIGFLGLSMLAAMSGASYCEAALVLRYDASVSGPSVFAPVIGLVEIDDTHASFVPGGTVLLDYSGNPPVQKGILSFSFSVVGFDTFDSTNDWPVMATMTFGSTTNDVIAWDFGIAGNPDNLFAATDALTQYADGGAQPLGLGPAGAWSAVPEPSAATLLVCLVAASYCRLRIRGSCRATT